MAIKCYKHIFVSQIINQLNINIMDANKFVNQQVKMIKEDFGLDQIKDNIYRYFVRYHLPNITLDALIHRCMEMYAEVLKRHSQTCKSCGKNIAEVCGSCLSDIAHETSDQAMNSSS